MELIDYLRNRWVRYAVALVLGLVAIIALGLRSEGDRYVAQTTIIVRPPATSLTAYASDLDRYVDTEMTLLRTPGGLSEVAKEFDVSASQLVGSFSFSHESGSDLVVMRIENTDPRLAVEMVNEVARAYLADAQRRLDAPSKERARQVEAAVVEVERRLKSVSAEIRNDVAAFVQANPGDPVPQAEILSPGAAAREPVLTARLQRLYDVQTDLEFDDQVTTRSQIVAPARSAFLPSGWGITAYLGAVVGLVLLLLTIAGLGYAMSNRVIGQGRWNELTRESSLRQSIRFRGTTTRARGRTHRRILDSLGGPATNTAPIGIAFLPDPTPAIRRRSETLIQELAESGLEPRALGPLSSLGRELRSPLDETASRTPAQIVLLVDAAHATTDDVNQLNDLPPEAQRLMVPVLL